MPIATMTDLVAKAILISSSSATAMALDMDCSGLDIIHLPGISVGPRRGPAGEIQILLSSDYQKDPATRALEHEQAI